MAKTRNAQATQSAPNIIGTVFYANADGCDPEHLDVSGFNPGGMYIRLNTADGLAYINAYTLGQTITTIDNMSKNKATTAALNALATEVNNTKATKVELEALSGVVDTKLSAAAIDGITATLETKADEEDIAVLNTSISALNNELSGRISSTEENIELIESELNLKATTESVESLTATVNEKADSSEIANINARLDEVESDIDALNDLSNDDNITSMQNQLEDLNTRVSNCLTVDSEVITSLNSSVTNINADLDTLEEDIDQLRTAVNSKASTIYVEGQLTDIHNVLAAVNSAIDTKADIETVANKANQSDLLQVQTNINDLVSDIIGINQNITEKYDEVTAKIDAKANIADVESNISTINAAISEKADTTYVDSKNTELKNRVDTFEGSLESTVKNYANESIDLFECEINNTISELRSSVNSNRTKLSTQETNISLMQKSLESHDDLLQQKWVRVLSTREFERLYDNPPANSSYDNRYKYPNTVYLVVDFNKPKAIYIGDILIAKAEQTGSVGFVYTFPIVF